MGKLLMIYGVISATYNEYISIYRFKTFIAGLEETYIILSYNERCISNEY